MRGLVLALICVLTLASSAHAAEADSGTREQAVASVKPHKIQSKSIYVERLGDRYLIGIGVHEP
jgi:hypothetical protein